VETEEETMDVEVKRGKKEKKKRKTTWRLSQRAREWSFNTGGNWN
jgi:hypothetical protein